MKSFKQSLSTVYYSLPLHFLVNELGEEGALALAEVIDISPLPWLKMNLNGVWSMFLK